MTELFSFQGPRGRTFRPAAGAAWEIVPSLTNPVERSICTLKIKVFQKISDFNDTLTYILVGNAISFR